MATYARVGAKKEYPLISQGTHVGTIYKFMNLGTRYQECKGVLKDYPDTLISITFETDEEHEFTFKKEDSTEEKVTKPLVISKEFTLSMGAKSNLRPFVEGVIGVKLTDEEAAHFDLEDLLGRSCLVSIVHKESKDGRVFANIAGTSPLMKNMQPPILVNNITLFDINTATLEEVEALPKFAKEKVIISDEYKRRFLAPEPTPEYASDASKLPEYPEHTVAPSFEKPEEINPEDIPFN